jgi:phasin family protein
MATTKGNGSPRQDFFEEMKKFQMPGFDYELSMQWYRKNMEAISQTQKALLDMMKEITHLNTEYTRQMMEGMREHHKQLTEAKTLEEKSQLASDKFRDQMDHLLAHNRKVADIWTKSCTSVGERISSRIQDNMREAQSMVQKASTGRH